MFMHFVISSKIYHTDWTVPKNPTVKLKSIMAEMPVGSGPQAEQS
jgi:hypothetical protein